MLTHPASKTIIPLPTGSIPPVMPGARLMPSVAETTLAYSLWAERLVDDGWTPYLLTFMFRAIGGPAHDVMRAMEREVERVYATVLPRIVRNPTRPSMVGSLPIWFCALDRPVFKHNKVSLQDVVINDGLHAHAVALLPPWSRLTDDLATHFEDYQSLFIRSEFLLRRIHVKPITEEVGYVVQYIRKNIRRDGEDAGFVLPRALSEVRDRAA